jgi:hypothetical protein
VKWSIKTILAGGVLAFALFRAAARPLPDIWRRIVFFALRNDLERVVRRRPEQRQGIEPCPPSSIAAGAPRSGRCAPRPRGEG